jgi:hypothetical protein
MVGYGALLKWKGAIVPTFCARIMKYVNSAKIALLSKNVRQGYNWSPYVAGFFSALK